MATMTSQTEPHLIPFRREAGTKPLTRRGFFGLVAILPMVRPSAPLSPVADSGRPSDTEMDAMLKAMEDAIRAGDGVLVHEMAWATNAAVNGRGMDQHVDARQKAARSWLESSDRAADLGWENQRPSHRRPLGVGARDT
jgi:hypothetical protein